MTKGDIYTHKTISMQMYFNVQHVKIWADDLRPSTDIKTYWIN